VSERVYRLWHDDGVGSISKVQTDKPPAVLESPTVRSPRPTLTNIKSIVDKNLFDPERGVGQVQETQASSGAAQQIQKMILLGTAILGSSRYALLEEGSGGGRPTGARARAGPENILRLKLGDTVEGFQLSEIHEDRVVFTKGASKIEIILDFFRKIDDANQRPAIPTRPQRPPRQITTPRPRTPRQAVPTPTGRREPR
jgi:hypothetical protein